MTTDLKGSESTKGKRINRDRQIGYYVVDSSTVDISYTGTAIYSIDREVLDGRGSPIMSGRLTSWSKRFRGRIAFPLRCNVV